MNRDHKIVRTPSLIRDGAPVKYRAEFRQKSSSSSPSKPLSNITNTIKTEHKSSSSSSSNASTPEKNRSTSSKASSTSSSPRPSSSTKPCKFEDFPNEVFFFILNHLNTLELSRLALTSKKIGDRVQSYIIDSKYGHKHLFSLKCFDKQNRFMFDGSCQCTLDEFGNAGIFLKRLTFLKSPKYRLDLFCLFLHSLNLDLEHRSCTNANYTTFKFRFKCVGKMVYQFLRGWDYVETAKMLTLLENYYGLPMLIKSFTRFSNGTMKLAEYYIRYFYRMVFFDSHSCIRDKAFWINEVLEKHSYSSFELLKVIDRSRLLILFFGPLIGNPGDISIIGWDSIGSVVFIDDELSSLGNSLATLYKFNAYFSNVGIFRLIMAITKYPASWRSENVAALLFHAGISITQEFFKFILKTNDLDTANMVLVYLCIISTRRDQSWFMEIIDFLHHDDPNFFGNFKFMLRELPESFFRIALTREAFDLEEEDFEEDIDVYDIVKSMSEVLQLLLNRLLKYGSV